MHSLAGVDSPCRNHGLKDKLERLREMHEEYGPPSVNAAVFLEKVYVAVWNMKHWTLLQRARLSQVYNYQLEVMERSSEY